MLAIARTNAEEEWGEAPPRCLNYIKGIKHYVSELHQMVSKGLISASRGDLAHQALVREKVV